MNTAISPADERTIRYTPMGETDEVTLKIGTVRAFLTSPTKSGRMPDDAEIVKFMMLCKARQLNPWVGDAYLVGYDGKDGPTFSLITSIQALYKRAEQCPAYRGIESGVIIKAGDGISYRQGDIVLDGETLLGGWAKVYREDRDMPDYDALKLSTYDTGRSQWAKDPAGMICKCAEGSALRKAFPSQTGGMYIPHEMDEAATSHGQQQQAKPQLAKGTLDALADDVLNDEPPAPVPAPQRKRRKRRTKAEMEAAREPDPLPAPVPAATAPAPTAQPLPPASPAAAAPAPPAPQPARQTFANSQQFQDNFEGALRWQQTPADVDKLAKEYVAHITCVKDAEYLERRATERKAQLSHGAFQ